MVTKEEETEVELELGLSIGGNYRKPNGDVLRSETSDKIETSCFVKDSVQELDQRTKREIHAMRRQEAKKKRELKKGFSCKDYNFNTDNVKTNVNDKINNEVWLKGKDFQVSNNSDERESKKSRTEGVRFDGDNDNGGFYLRPVPLHYGSPENGFVYPCWFTGGVAVAEDKNVGPTVGCGFVPFQARGYNLGNGHNSEPSWSVDGSGNRKVGSNNGSPLCTSSAGSDRCWSSSHEAGGSSYTRSRSSPSFAEQSHWHGLKAAETKGLSDHTATSQLKECDPVNESQNQVGTTTQPNNEQSSPTRLKEAAKLETERVPTEKHLSAPENPTYTPLTEGKVDVGKPPKPQSQNQNSPSLPYMPCVSTTGDGPNGKTINGFLYRYTKAEVSIICVCHGRSFSPAEFVQHAGGTDVSHPLRHITVVPSAF